MNSKSPAFTPDKLPLGTHWTLLLLLFVYTMSFTDRQIIGILMQPIKTEFGVSDTAMGLLSGLAFALFYSALGVPMARYADHANRRNFVAYCCGAWSAMTALCGMAVGFWTLALARVGVAVGEAGGTPPSLSMVADHYPPGKRGRAMSVYMLGPQLGIIFGLALGGWIAHQYGWRQAFLWMAIPGIAAALLLRFTGVEPRRGAWEASAAGPGAGSAPAAPVREPFGAVARDLWQSKAFVRVTLAGLMLGFAGYGIGVWTPSFLVRSHGLSLKDAGAAMGLLGGLAAVVGTLIAGWLSDRLARRDARWRLGVPVLGCVIALPAGPKAWDLVALAERKAAMFEGSGTPWLTPQELGAMGYRQISYPVSVMFRAVNAIQAGLAELRAHALGTKPMTPLTNAVEVRSILDNAVELKKWRDVEERFGGTAPSSAEKK